MKYNLDATAQMGLKFMQLLGSYDIGEKSLLGTEESILKKAEQILNQEYDKIHMPDDNRVEQIKNIANIF